MKNSNISTEVGFKVDRGTATDTTVKVDKGTFNQIMDYSLNNKDCKWDEIGCDGSKKWVVIDGQRFDYSLTKEEKEAFQKRWKTCCSIASKTESGKDKNKSNTDHKKLISIAIDKDNNIKIDKDEKEANNPKVINLMKKPKVAKMLSNIIKANSGRSISLNLD